jgi:hypothetical protein
MPSEGDLFWGLVDEPGGKPERLSDWLQDQDVLQLAVLARSARAVDGSFGRHLCEHE